MTANSPFVEFNNLVELQKQAYDCFAKGNYSEAVSLYQQAIDLDSAVKANYWYLGLSQLLEGQELDAQMTWLLAIEDGELEQIEQWTEELVEVLKQAALQRENSGDYQRAYAIRYQLREVKPNDFDNLAAIISISIQLETFTPKELIELGIVDLLELEEDLQVEEDLLLDLLRKILTYASPDELVLQFTKACLPHLGNTKVAIDKLLQIGLKIERDYDIGRAIEVAMMYRQIDEENLNVLSCLTNFHSHNGNFEKSIETARECYTLFRNSGLAERVIVSSLFLLALKTSCRYWEEIIQIYDKSESLLKDLIAENPLGLSLPQAAHLLVTGFYTPCFKDTPQETQALRQQVRQFANIKIREHNKERIDRYQKQQAIRRKINISHRPLKIGYISASLRRHSVGYLARWLFQYHDRERFQLYGYFVGYKETDDLQKWFASQVHQVFKGGPDDVDNSNLDCSLELAERIHQDGIDILVDLDSLTSAVGSKVLALKPAPIQVTWLGWDAAGQPEVDYFIADPYVLPESAQDYYSETIWRLPHTYIAVDGFESAVPTIRRDRLDIPNDAVVYFSAQNSIKRHPDTARLQVQILKSVPNSYLLIKSMGDQDSLVDFWHQLAKSEELSIDRLRFLPITAGEAEHRANLSIADVVLDTYPYNGATHTLETLWMGIPIVTRVGEQFAARNSYSMMINAGIAEGIARTDEEYVEWGVRLGTDPALRQQIFWKLRESRQTSPLWNARQFTREMETAYEQMWAKYLDSDVEDRDLESEDRSLLATEAELQNTQGISYAQQGRVDEAIERFQAAILLRSDYVDAHYNLGIAFSEQGSLDEAIVSFHKAINLNPNRADALYNLGLILVRQGRVDEAISYYQQALTISPEDVEIHLALGNVFFEQSKLEAAIGCYQTALTLDSKCADAYCGIAAVFSSQGRFTEAFAHLQSALAINPRFAQAYCNLGIAFSNSDQFAEAIDCFQKALQIQPDLGDAYWYLGVLFSKPQKSLGVPHAARRQFADRFVEVCGKTDKIRALLNIITSYTFSGLSDLVRPQLSELEAYIYENYHRFTKRDAQVLYACFVFLLYSLRDNPEANSKTSRLIGELLVEKAIKPELEIITTGDWSSASSKIGASKDTRRLRIGLLSSNFCRHPVSWCSFDITRELSHLTPHIYLYAVEDMKLDDRTQMFEQVAEKFYWQSQNTNQNNLDMLSQVIRQISQDEIDILIDLDSATQPVHAHILYQQPAPICLSWLGFDAPFISPDNYCLCDWHTHPPEVERHYLEKLIRLPHSHMAIAGFEYVPIDRDAQRNLLGISSDQVAYLFAAPGRKFNSDIARACIQILQFVPNSVLLHKGYGDLEAIHTVYQKECDVQGVNRDRIKFLAGTKTEEEHRSSYLLADIFLDAYPYNGGTHNMEALWFNLPVVTRAGEQSFARMGYSFLQTLGIRTGIAWSWEEYVEWGIQLGRDANLRNGIREQLIRSKQPENLSPLWNPKQFARDMYAIFEKLLAEQIQCKTRT